MFGNVPFRTFKGAKPNLKEEEKGKEKNFIFFVVDKMLESRISLIAEKLEKHGNVEVKTLSREFQVSEKTIRQDLEKMEKMGLLKRVHGGAVSINKNSVDAYSHSARTVGLPSKERIARKAYDYLRSIGTVGIVCFVDAGTSTYEFARLLRNLTNIVITNDLFIASLLSSSEESIHVTGGHIVNNVNQYLVGPDALEMIEKHSAKICFLGATAISLTGGFMTQTNEDAQIKKAMMANSEIKVCLADHSKFEKTSFVKYAQANEFDVIITDEASPDEIEAFKKIGVQLLCAQERVD
jgi:DeoR/GlpR family transcriptional regulator of sugar metabolism